MNHREHLQHKPQEITLFLMAIVLLASISILLFPANLAIGRADRLPSYTQSR